jgi:hypothetical protein
MPDDKDLDSILEQCLAQIDSGQARVQTCLLAYPSRADELEPLLLAAEQIRAIPKPKISPEARTQIEAQLTSTVHQARPGSRWLAPIGSAISGAIGSAIGSAVCGTIGGAVGGAIRRARQHGRIGPHLRLALIGLAALLIMATGLTYIANAAAESLPGSRFYAMKLAAEDARLWLTPNRSKPSLHLRLAQRRLDEVETLADQGPVDPTFLEAMIQQTEETLESVEGLPPAIILPVLEDTVRLMARQRQSLAGLVKDAPVSSRERVATALNASEEQASRAQALIAEARQGQPPDPRKTPPGHTRTPQPPPAGKKDTPPGQTKTPEPPGHSYTPKPTKTPKLTKTPKPSKTPKPIKPSKTPKPVKPSKTPKS